MFIGSDFPGSRSLNSAFSSLVMVMEAWCLGNGLDVGDGSSGLETASQTVSSVVKVFEKWGKGSLFIRRNCRCEVVVIIANRGIVRGWWG